MLDWHGENGIWAEYLEWRRRVSKDHFVEPPGAWDEIERIVEQRVAVLTGVYTPATIKSDWELPPRPECGHGIKAIAAVIWTGDCWEWGWDAVDCDRCGPDPFVWTGGHPGIGDVIQWPFVEDWVTAEDWRQAGFEVM